MQCGCRIVFSLAKLVSRWDFWMHREGSFVIICTCVAMLCYLMSSRIGHTPVPSRRGVSFETLTSLRVEHTPFSVEVLYSTVDAVEICRIPWTLRFNHLLSIPYSFYSNINSWLACVNHGGMNVQVTFARNSTWKLLRFHSTHIFHAPCQSNFLC